jgi:hypothetical protein
MCFASNGWLGILFSFEFRFEFRFEFCFPEGEFETECATLLNTSVANTYIYSKVTSQREDTLLCQLWLVLFLVWDWELYSQKQFKS